jgi:hypothetical protein
VPPVACRHRKRRACQGVGCWDVYQSAATIRGCSSRRCSRVAHGHIAVSVGRRARQRLLRARWQVDVSPHWTVLHSVL